LILRHQQEPIFLQVTRYSKAYNCDEAVKICFYGFINKYCRKKRQPSASFKYNRNFLFRLTGAGTVI